MVVENSIDKSFKDSVTSDKAIDIAKDFLEVGLDSLLKDGLLKEIPIVGTIIGFGKIAWSIKDKHTLKKIAIFLSRLSEISSKERKEFAEKLTEDKFKETVSEKVLLVIERLDETAKAEIIGNLFCLYIQEVISKEEFLRFSNIVEKAFLYDLLSFHNRFGYFKVQVDKAYHWSERIAQTLQPLGLFEQSFNSPIVGSILELPRDRGMQPKSEYKLTPIGEKLAKLMYYDLQNNYFIEYFNHLKLSQKGNIVS